MQIDTTAAQATRQAFWTGRNGLWLPPQDSTTAPEIDSLFHFILYASIVLTIIVTVAMVYFIWKYRRRSHTDRPRNVHESKWLEVSWIVIPTVLVACRLLPAASAPTSGPRFRRAMPSRSRSTRRSGRGQFEYDNGMQGFGEFWVPAGRPIKLTMTSQDVLHSFYVPEFRIKHDVLPNRFSFVWFDAPDEGVYQVLCTEYCGTGHSNMGAKIHVVSTQEYYRILREGPPGDAGAVAPAALGARLWSQRNCKTCHSVDGSAGVGPSWKGIWMQPSQHVDGGSMMTDADVHQAVDPVPAGAHRRRLRQRQHAVLRRPARRHADRGHHGVHPPAQRRRDGRRHHRRRSRRRADSTAAN